MLATLLHLTALGMGMTMMLACGIVLIALMLLALIMLACALRRSKRSYRRLVDLQQAREQLFASISHELRSPLTVILGMSRKLRDSRGEATTRQVQGAAEMIERQGDRLQQLVNQLQHLSEVQVSAGATEWHHDNIVALVGMMVDAFYDQAHHHHIELIYAPRENEVRMDFAPDYVQHIVGQLLTTAMKHAPMGGHVNIITRRDGHTFVLQVSDDGAGLDTSDELALTWQLVNALDGQFTVISGRDKGTVYTVALPIAMESDTLPMAASPHTDGDGADRPTVLVVEDHRDVATYIAGLLSQHYNVVHAANGRIALDKVGRQLPDLIVTDLMMPVMDGIELCHLLRADARTCHVPVVMVTARASTAYRVKALKAGVDAYLTKPFNANELKVSVEKLLEQRSILRAKFTHSIDNSFQLPMERNTAADVDVQFLERLDVVINSLISSGQSDVDSVASAMNMSPSQLRRKVQALTGKTPSAYILQMRLGNAQHLLDSQPQLNISEVAYRCGFSDQAHFGHAFQKAFGVSPTQWARRAKA